MGYSQITGFSVLFPFLWGAGVNRAVTSQVPVSQDQRLQVKDQESYSHKNFK